MSIRKADDIAYVLGEALTGTGNSVAVKGGEYLFMVNGTAGGGTDFRLEVQAPNGTWSRLQVFTGSVVSFTAANLPISQTGIDLPSCNVRIFIAGAATSINAYLVGLG
jgi:hypothetical protein